MLINLRMRFEQIAFVLKKIVPVINYVIMTTQCARRTFKVYTIKKTGVLTIVILRRYNNCNIGAGTRM